jgi:capsular polysaccharide biosynthesis protein
MSNEALVTTPQIHQITPLGTLESMLPPQAGGRPRVERLADIYPAQVPIAPIAFGHTDLSTLTMAEHPRAGAWAETSYQAAGKTVHLLRNAVIRSDTGIVTMDQHVVAETLLRIPDHMLPGERVEGGIAFHPNENTVQLGRAAHLLAGNYDNYFHWMNDVVARSLLAEALGPGASLLFGIFRVPFHPSTVDLLGPSSTPRQGLGLGVSVEVAELLYVPGLSGYGFEPHPCMLPVFDRLRANAGTGKSPARRLYISRLGSERRKLLNEPEIVALLGMHGFEAVQLDGMDVRSQVLLFAEASHIVAPHGAGLTNLLFCSPGTTVLELLPTNYVNWCFRRAASLRQLRYGCLVGEAPAPWNTDWPHANSWTLPLGDLATVMNSAAFS